MNEREIVSRWIEERAREKNAPALTWALQRASCGLLDCYPKGHGKDIVSAAGEAGCGALSA